MSHAKQWAAAASVIFASTICQAAIYRCDTPTGAEYRDIPCKHAGKPELEPGADPKTEITQAFESAKRRDDEAARSKASAQAGSASAQNPNQQKQLSATPAQPERQEHRGFFTTLFLGLAIAFVWKRYSRPLTLAFHGFFSDKSKSRSRPDARPKQQPAHRPNIQTGIAAIYHQPENHWPSDRTNNYTPDGEFFACQAPLAITYRDFGGAVTRRVIVVKQFQEDPNGYLRGWCELRKDLRTFRYDRIESAADPSSGEVIDDALTWLMLHKSSSINPVS